MLRPEGSVQALAPRDTRTPDVRARRVAAFSVAFALLWLLAWYGETTRGIVTIWHRSPTFTHGFVIVPVVLWLVWRARARLAACAIAPWWPGLALLGLAGLGWLVSRQAGVNSGMYFMLAAMIALCTWTIAGTAVARTLAFPLGYLFFAVPFGEFLVPPLMDWTANFAIFLLRASGIPVFREGIHFAIPTGRWSVVEECSGINYLIASVAVGTLFAYLTFRSLRRRLVFVVLSAVIPLIANGVRAYIIVMIAYLTDNRLAVGVDHLLLGWVLFGGVMLLTFWAGSYWAEPDVVGSGAGPAPRAKVVVSPAAFVVAGLAAIVCASIWSPLADTLDRLNAKPETTLAPIAGANGWAAESGPLVDWTPQYQGAMSTVTQVFVRNGERVGLTLLLYRNQTDDRKLITTSNQLVYSRDVGWRATASGHRSTRLGSEPIAVDTLELKSARDDVLAWHWYWLGSGRYTTSDVEAKLQQALSRMLGRGDDAALVTVYTHNRGAATSASARLDEFTRDMGPSIDRALREAVR